MKSIRTDPSNHASEGDELDNRIRARKAADWLNRHEPSRRAVFGVTTQP